jgi:hypothetical protein
MFEKFNQERSAIQKKFMLPGFGLVVVGVILYLLGLPEVAIPFGIIGVVVAAIGFSKSSNLAKALKEKYLFELLQKNFDGVSYNPNRGVTIQDVLESELLQRSDRFYSNDLIEASYNGINFTMSDIHMQEVVHRDKRTEVRTVFQGPFMKFTFNKNFKGKLQVRERGFVTWFSKYKKVKMESMTFNKKFTTYSTEDHTAFYILTPHLMEELLEMERARRGDFYFSFIDGEMFIALDNRRDNFELPTFAKIDESIGDKFEHEFNIIKEIIDELKLNKNIFK